MFIGFIKKEIYHITRDIRTLLILILMPIVQMLLFGYVINNDIKNAKIAIYDQAKDNVTRKLTKKILSSGYFQLERTINNYKEIDNSFKKNEIKLVLIFEPDFADKLQNEAKANVQIITDASEPNTAEILVNYNLALINEFSKEYNNQNNQNSLIGVESRMFYNAGLKSVYMFVPGLMGLLLMLISAMMTSISITKEKEMGNMEILLVSPLKPYQIVIGKVIPYIALSFFNSIIIIILSIFIFKIPMQGNLMLLLGECILYIMVALSLGIFISTITSSQQVAMIISLVGLMLPSMLLSGFIYPIENMPQILQWLCMIMPPKYFIIIIKGIMLKGNAFIYVWKETLILVFMFLIFIVLSIKNFKIRLE
ncbi:MAG: ABC transporter permease [Bacteroidales bacterium]|nr:ABC transporter permease [Bacteroidales bacterium]